MYDDIMSDIREPAEILNGFKVNKCGVVLNPNVPICFEHETSYLKIRTANANNWWHYDVSIMLPKEGMGGPVSAIPYGVEYGFKTEEEALEKATEEAKSWLLRNARESEARDKMMEFLEGRNQLTMF